MSVPARDDADRRWSDVAIELERAAPLSRARRAAANAVVALWVALVVGMLIALAVPVFGMTGQASRSGWQIVGAVGVLLLAAVGLLRGVRPFSASTLRRLAPIGAERRVVRRQLAGRAPVPSRRGPVIGAIAAEEQAVMLLVLAAIGTYLLGYLDGVAANRGSADATIDLPLLVTVFVLAAVLPAVRLVGALRYRRAHPSAA